MSDDPFSSPEWREYEKRCREELLPMMEGSNIAVSLVPSGMTDVKFAVGLGFMIMLDKPIIAVIPPGTKVPLKLARVCDEIVEGNVSDPTVRERLMAAIERVGEKYSPRKREL